MERLTGVRTGRASLVSVGPGQVEPWRIVVELQTALLGGGPVAVRSDDVDAPFDETLDLIRYDHPVVETG